jgi:hypothetical protein
MRCSAEKGHETDTHKANGVAPVPFSYGYRQARGLVAIATPSSIPRCLFFCGIQQHGTRCSPAGWSGAAAREYSAAPQPSARTESTVHNPQSVRPASAPHPIERAKEEKPRQARRGPAAHDGSDMVTTTRLTALPDQPRAGLSVFLKQHSCLDADHSPMLHISLSYG